MRGDVDWQSYSKNYMSFHLTSGNFLFQLMITDPDTDIYLLKVDMKSGKSKFVSHDTNGVDKTVHITLPSQHPKNGN